jgi:DNA-binding MarR family transcriptional regulator
MLENHTLFTKMVFDLLENQNLTTGQPKVLGYLLRHDGAIQKDIATACQIEPATVTSLLSRMEKKHLVERRMKEGDRRFLCTYLTDLGRKKAVEVEKAFAQLEEIALDGFSEEEKEAFFTFLEDVNKNLKQAKEDFYNDGKGDR